MTFRCALSAPDTLLNRKDVFKMSSLLFVLDFLPSLGDNVSERSSTLKISTRVDKEACVCIT